MPPKARPLLDRFEENMNRGAPDTCWEWGGTIRKGDGYGVICDEDGRRQRAHRVAFFFAHGYVPDEVCHTCDNPPCCNDRHLFDGTHAQNMQDSWDKGRAGGPPAENAVKTHCDHGHEFTVENTYLRPDRPGARECRACRVVWVAACRRRKREAAGSHRQG